MSRTIKIRRYDGADKRSADQLLALTFLTNGVFATPPTSSDRELRTLHLLEDAASILSGDGGTGGDISHSPLIQSFLNASWLGEAILACIQAVSPIPDTILNNIKTWVCFRCPNPAEAQRMAKLVRGKPELAETIQRLPPRHFIALSEGFEGPIHGITPTITTGARPTDAQIDDHMRPLLEEIEKDLVLSPPYEEEYAAPIVYLEDDVERTRPEPQPDLRSLSDSPAVLGLYMRYLTAVASNQYHSVRELNSALGVSAGKSARLKADLESAGYISVHKEPGTTGRPRLVVQIEAAGLRLLENWK